MIYIEKTIRIERRITEVDERWSQTEREVQDFKAEVSTKIKKMKETNKKVKDCLLYTSRCV